MQQSRWSDQQSISSAEIIRASAVHVQIPTKPFRNVRATTPPDTQECEWIWTHEQKDTFQKIKDAVKKSPVLKYFSDSRPAEGQGDASKDGLGFLLLQYSQPVTSRHEALPATNSRKSREKERERERERERESRRRSRLHSCQSLPSRINKGLVSLRKTWQLSYFLIVLHTLSLQNFKKQKRQLTMLRQYPKEGTRTTRNLCVAPATDNFVEK